MQEKQWTDKCTSLKPNDERYQEAQKLVSTTGCSKENNLLTECLKRHQKDWRQCKNETMELNSCLKSRPSR